MNKMKSGIILKDTVFLPDNNNHNNMLKELFAKDTKTEVACVELYPANGDVFSNIETWSFNICQYPVPNWFDKDKYKERMVKAVKEWAKKRIYKGADGLNLYSGSNYYLKDCTNVTLRGTVKVAIICGISHVESMYESAMVETVLNTVTINYISDSAVVETFSDTSVVGVLSGTSNVNNMYGLTTIKTMSGSSKVGIMCGSASVGIMRGESAVAIMHDTSEVSIMLDSTSVMNMCGASSVKTMCDKSTIKKMSGASSVGTMLGTAVVKDMHDTASVITMNGMATIGTMKDYAMAIISNECAEQVSHDRITLLDKAILKDNRKKTIYQAANSDDWKIVKKPLMVPQM
jgi:small nuclear ribonucleoprotein (snRNP)-like protein